MVEKLKRISEFEERLNSCVAVGDCTRALKGPYSKPILEAACPMIEHSPGFEAFISRGKFAVALALLDGKIEPSEGLAEVIFQCTLCGACREVCNNPMNPCITISARENIMDHMELWEALRADLVDAGVAPMLKHKEIIGSMKSEYNPYFEKHDERLKWIPENANYLQKGGDALFFVGCTSAYRLNDISSNFLEIANKAGIKLSIIPDERCCGSVSLRTGDVNTTQKLAKHNFETFKSAGVDKIVATCAGCYKTLKSDYPKLINDWDFEVLHSIEMVNHAIKSGKIKISNKIHGTITYHDPCHLGRHSGVYDAPREVIDAIRADDFVEMRRNKKFAFCCGAGGGVKSAFPDLAYDIASERFEEAEDTGASYLATTCPFCLNNLQLAASARKTPVHVVDLLELVKKAIL